MTAVIQEAYVQGISRRSVDDLLKAPGMSGVPKSQVSRLCAELDEGVGAWQPSGQLARRHSDAVSNLPLPRALGRHASAPSQGSRPSA